VITEKQVLKPHLIRNYFEKITLSVLTKMIFFYFIFCFAEQVTDLMNQLLWIMLKDVRVTKS